MANQTQQLIKTIKSNSLKPVYLLHGDEPFYLETLLDKIEDIALPEASRSFNQFVVYGKETDLNQLMGLAKRFPMMADRQLIIVKNAQDIQDLKSKDKLKVLEDYLTKPLNTTVLVMQFGESQDERKAWVKAFGKNGEIVASKKLYDNELPEFVSNYCHDKGVKISMKAIQMLIEHVGNDLKRLTTELEKIFINLKVNENIEAAVIEKYVGVSKEYNVFEFQKALGSKDFYKSMVIANKLASNVKDNPVQPMVILLYNYFTKVLVVNTLQDKSEQSVASSLGIKPFFAREYVSVQRNYNIQQTKKAIDAIKNADLKSKGIVGSQDDLLKELVIEILK